MLPGFKELDVCGPEFVAIHLYSDSPVQAITIDFKVTRVECQSTCNGCPGKRLDISNPAKSQIRIAIPAQAGVMNLALRQSDQPKDRVVRGRSPLHHMSTIQTYLLASK